MLIRPLALFLGLAACSFAGVPVALPAATAEPEKFDLWSFDFESGALWRVTNETHLDYLVLPQIFSLRTPQHIRYDFANGAALTVRARLSLLVEPIAEGPESLYLGISGSPSIELWSPGRDWAAYLSAGGGIGWIDSQGVAGGQGQDRTFNWFVTGGVRWYLQEHFSLSAGVMFQHFSNRGQTDPNPGLDQFGPMLGLSWSF